MRNKIKLLTVLNLAMYLISCGPLANDMQDRNIDANLVKYLNNFQNEGLARGISTNSSHLRMGFSESMPVSEIPNSFVLAYCQRSSQGPSIVVKGSTFNNMSISDREQLVFHELGHCLLNLGHDDSTENALDHNGGTSYASDVPSSIMNKLNLNSTYYNLNRNEYLNRLFRSKMSSLYWNGTPQFDPAIYN